MADESERNDKPTGARWGTYPQRNEMLCRYYEEGHTVGDCVRFFNLGKQRVIQILQRAGVWRRRGVSVKRDKFLGLHVTATTKAALLAQAASSGKTLSKYVSDILEQYAPDTESDDDTHAS